MCLCLEGFSYNLYLVSESPLSPSPSFSLSPSLSPLSPSSLSRPLSFSLSSPPSFSVFVPLSLIFLKKRYFSPIKLLHVSIILETANTLIFQNSIISRPSRSPEVWRLFWGCPGARGQRLSFASALNMRGSDGVVYAFS